VIRTLSIFCALIALFGWVSAAPAAESKEELQKRFKDRLPQIDQLKKQGVIGETSEGYLDFVEGSSGKHGDLVNEENGDRRKLYALIAKETGTDAEIVAKRAAKRNFDRAQPGQYLKENGTWRKK
jgi:uncharacterized protein YdbL (DUF1318 family)